MTADQPTLAEVLRRLDELGNRLVDLTTEIREDRRTADQTYVRRETYNANRAADDRRFKELEQDNENQSGFRRQVLAGLILLFIGTVVTTILTLNGLQK